MLFGPARLLRVWKSPEPRLTAVTVNDGWLRRIYCSMREPSVDAKNFCSFWKVTAELTKLTPLAFIAVSFNFSRKRILSSIEMSNGSFSYALFQLALTVSAGARVTGLRWYRALARAMST